MKQEHPDAKFYRHAELVLTKRVISEYEYQRLLDDLRVAKMETQRPVKPPIAGSNPAP